jgi:hypothetical protein
MPERTGKPVGTVLLVVAMLFLVGEVGWFMTSLLEMA